MRARFPRVVQPNGFIERDLSLSMASDRYHVTNVKDLLRLYEIARESWLRPYIRGGVTFLRGLVARDGIEHLLRRSPYFMEVVDVLELYSRLIEPVPAAEIDAVRTGVFSAMGGCSLEGEMLGSDPIGRPPCAE
jgi:hypothetical protein